MAVRLLKPPSCPLELSNIVQESQDGLEQRDEL